MNICVIEEHPILQLAIKVMLDDAVPGAKIVYNDNFDKALKSIDSQKFELVILAIHVSEVKNILMIQLAKAKQPGMVILIYSAFDEEIYALPYMSAGADGYLCKNAEADEFILAIKTVLNHQKYLSKSFQFTLIKNIAENKNRKNPLQTLSPMEVIVMQYIVEGKSTTEIASEMKIKQNTVSTFKSRIFNKLAVRDSLELTKKVSMLKNFQ